MPLRLPSQLFVHSSSPRQQLLRLQACREANRQQRAPQQRPAQGTPQAGQQPGQPAWRLLRPPQVQQQAQARLVACGQAQNLALKASRALQPVGPGWQIDCLWVACPPPKVLQGKG